MRHCVSMTTAHCQHDKVGGTKRQANPQQANKAAKYVFAYLYNFDVASVSMKWEKGIRAHHNHINDSRDTQA